MPHIDELFAVSTLASAALFAAIALQPAASAVGAAAGDAVRNAAAPAPTALTCRVAAADGA
jgi:hypothetical protein